MVPLDQAQINSAQLLANAITDVQTILIWNASAQAFNFYVPDPVVAGGYGDHPDFTNGNFTVTPGYPYWVCMGSSKNWP